jgi:transposase-like protein
MTEEEEGFNYNSFKESAIEGLKAGKGLTGTDNVLVPMIKDILESAMQGELEWHLKEEHSSDSGSKNRKNGYTSKTMKTTQGSFQLDTPRDRNSTFSPEIIEKQQTFLGNSFQDMILSLYSSGLTYSDIQKHLQNQYGFSISKGKLTEVTNRILPQIAAWKNRTLEPVYAFVWMDALHYSVRENGVTKKKAVYVVLGYDMYGKKDVLGLYIGKAESAKFWTGVLEDIQNRGVEDILIACMDNLSGFTRAVEAVFPLTNVQLCIIHQVRNSMKYVSHKNYQLVLKGLQTVYKAPNLDAAEIAMDEFEKQWDEHYPLVVKSWRKNWQFLTTFFDYSKDIRRIMYTTNIIEGFNRQLRKYTKTRGAFSSDDSLMKLLFMATMNISKNWTAKPPNWGQVQQQLIIKYEERCGIDF